MSRWSLFYLARPFIGAIMGLFVVVVFKSQLAADTLKNSDFYAVAAVAALAGLFSDSASGKLKEIFDVVLGPKADPRANGLENGTPKPSITNVKPSSLTVKQATPSLVVTGSGFSNKSHGRVNGQERKTTVQGSTQLTIELEPKDVDQAGKIKISVVDANVESPAVDVEVK